MYTKSQVPHACSQKRKPCGRQQDTLQVTVVTPRYDNVIARTEETEVGGSKPAQTASQDPVSKTKTKNKEPKR